MSKRGKRFPVVREIAKGALGSAALATGIDAGIIGHRALRTKWPKRIFMRKARRALPSSALVWGLVGGGLAAAPHVARRWKARKR